MHDQVVSTLSDCRIGANAHKGESLPGRFPQPLVQQLANQCQRRHQHQNGFTFALFGSPQRDQRFARAAGHHHGGAVVFLQSLRNRIQRFLLVWQGLLARQRYPSAEQPFPHRCKIIGIEAIQIAAANGDKTAAILHQGGQCLAIGNQHPLADLIGQPHKGGKLIPGECRAIAAEFDLIGTQLAINGQVSSIYAHVPPGVERKEFALLQRHSLKRPDLLRLSDFLSSQISFGKYLKGIAAFLIAGQRGNSGFEFSKVIQLIEQADIQQSAGR